MTSRYYKIHVPATSANIGPGFDVCGIALSLSLTLLVTIPPPLPSSTSSANASSSSSTLPRIAYSGLDASSVPLSPYQNLLTRVALYVLRSHAIPSFPPNVTIHAHNQIPFGRGLGSSGAAVVAGVLLGDLLGDLHLSKSRLLDFALMVERHPDNVTAALIGGFVGSYLKELSPADTSAASIPLAEVLPEYPPDAGPEWGLDPPRAPGGIGHWVRFGWASEVRAIAVMPRFELATAKARGVLPQSYSRNDMVSRPAFTGMDSLDGTAQNRCNCTANHKIGVQSSATGGPHHGFGEVAAGSRSDLRGDERSNTPAVPDGSGESPRIRRLNLLPFNLIYFGATSSLLEQVPFRVAKRP